MSTEARRVPPRPTHAPAPQLPSGTPPLPATPPPPSPSSRFPDTPPPQRGARNGASNDTKSAPANTTSTGNGAKASSIPLPPEAPPTETTTRLRPVPPAPTSAPRRPIGAVDLTPHPETAGRPFVTFARPEHYDDSTTRLRPVGSRLRPRAAAAAACLVLGLGLIGGAATGSLLAGDGGDDPASAHSAYHAAGELWHGIPVDRLFPPTLKGEGAGPGGADRTWTRIAVAPDSGCKGAFDPLLRKALRPAGCLRLLRATYTDATQSNVTTVGLMFTRADAEASQALRTRFTEQGLDRRTDLMPRPYAAQGTAAAGFGDAQRASWTIDVLTDAPVVVYAVSGFADGRTVADPEPAADAMKAGATTAPAQAGLGHEAQGIADRVERSLRKAVQKSTEQPS
ncbi:hypothetical protein [Streptomyces sp. NPDC052225]|uniref:hypothetical protein n=1 Tax=Streptomyces sp. NPDC052225 TaxID=3154949 RepID=UPI00341302B1